jgi:peroxiredoxin
MALTTSTMLPLQTDAPGFTLPDVVSGKQFTMPETGESVGTIIAFICNHCPSVKHIISAFVDLAKNVRGRGIRVIAISSNDVARYAEDGPEEMKLYAEKHGFTFPYLYDETQDVARAFHAECTPDLFLFDGKNKLVYRGRFDESTPGNGKPVTGADLTAAVNAVIDGVGVSGQQLPSTGCSIKWKR